MGYRVNLLAPFQGALDPEDSEGAEQSGDSDDGAAPARLARLITDHFNSGVHDQIADRRTHDLPPPDGFSLLFVTALCFTGDRAPLVLEDRIKAHLLENRTDSSRFFPVQGDLIGLGQA